MASYNKIQYLTNQFKTRRLWHKEKRFSLRDNVRQSFCRAATAPILGKHKLKKQSTKTDANGILEQVQNLKSQMQTIEMHLVNYDIIDVCNIVEPETNFMESMEIRGVHNLLTDHSQLTPPMVAISNFFYNTCVDQEYIGDNMSLLFQFLKNNTDEDLWTKCLEDYQVFHPLHQGGPLMFILILKKIRVLGAKNPVSRIGNSFSTWTSPH